MDSVLAEKDTICSYHGTSKLRAHYVPVPLILKLDSVIVLSTIDAWSGSDGQIAEGGSRNFLAHSWITDSLVTRWQLWIC